MQQRNARGGRERLATARLRSILGSAAHPTFHRNRRHGPISSVLHSVGLPLRAAIVRATRTDFPGLRTSRPAVCGQHISGSLIQVRVSQEAWIHVLTERSLALTPLWLSNSGSSLQLTTN